MTQTDQRQSPRRGRALGTTLGVILVVLAEFGLLTVVYHSGDGATSRQRAWSGVQGAQSAWRVGDPTTAVQRAVRTLDDAAGSRADRLDAATAAWVADPTEATYTRMLQDTNRLGSRLADDKQMVDMRAAIIYALLLIGASIGWFFWFRRVVQKQRSLQRSLTEFEVAMAGEQRLTALVRNSVDLVMVVDPDTTVSFASPSTQGVLGHGPATIVGTSVLDVVAPRDAPLLTGLLSAGGSGDQIVLLHARHADGRELVLEGTLTDLVDDENVNGWVLTVRDVTERLALQGELSHQASHDQLTGLPNRRLFTERLSYALRRRGGAVQPLVVLFVDIDDFKSINDSAGHSVGDQMLRTFAERLSSAIRQGDTAARLGGDEFAVLMEDIDPDAAQDLADALIDALTVPMTIGHSEVPVRCSVGLAAAQPGEATAEDVLRNADVAMYFAKNKGRGQVAVYDAELHAAALRRLQLRSELSSSIEAGDLVLHYQPTYQMSTGELEGYEALVRWQHPVDGLLYPDTFIDVAEQTGLIVPLGRWVLAEACRAAVRDLTTATTAPVMAVNVSVRQLVDDSFIEDVVRVLRETGLDPSRLVLEITESTLLDDRITVVERLEAIRALGVQFAIDDFGTGYSSLSYLSDLPVGILKIDKSFVDQLGRGGESLVEAIISMADGLGLVTLAEGVEEQHQLDWLRAAGCQIGQGYLWARPLPLAQARSVLTGPWAAHERSSEPVAG